MVSMKCTVCGLDIKEWDKKQKSHLVISKSHEGEHIHIHGDLDNKAEMKELIINAKDELGFPKMTQTLDRKEFVFHNRQRIGDILMFTCAIRDFKIAFPDTRVNVISTAMHLWDHNPHIDKTLSPTEENTVKIGPSRGTNQSNRVDWHFANAYRISIEDTLNIHIQQGESRPDIYFTKEEYDAPRLFDKPYWLIVIGGEKGWGCKMYPFNKWQKFVEQNPDTLFVQLGSQGDNHPRLQGSNVIDYIGKTENRDTGIRDLFKLFLNAEGSIGLVSFHMHLSGALYKPSIVIAGGREPVHFTRYEGHRYLSTDGCLPCSVNACWHCDIKACTNIVSRGEEQIPKCVDIIEPEELTKALNSYYIGGRLKKGVISPKPKLKNIVATPPKPIVIPEEPVTDIKTKYGLEFGGGSLTEGDWKFLRDTIKNNKVNSVLEFGAGLSTLLLNEMSIKVTTYETEQEWIDKTLALNPKCDIRLWDGLSLDLKEKYDLVFVDGPAGGASREFSTKIASEVSDILVVHDAGRPNEMKWQEKYLKGKFNGPGGGGSRCHLWSKNPNVRIDYRLGSPLLSKMLSPEVSVDTIEIKEIKTTDSPITVETFSVRQCEAINPQGKFIKFVSTAKGYGGCARSCLTIMKKLLQEGHRVEFIPFKNKVASREIQERIKNELPTLIVTENYNTVSEKCDIFFMYGDDYIWEFVTPEVSAIFSNINANKKIMMLNYRRGKVGQIPWTIGWDKYMFLNSTQEKELLKVLPGVKTKVLPPCTELDLFFQVQLNYNNNVRLVRHSSQGDVKFSKDFGEEINKILKIREDTEIRMIPGPSFVEPKDRYIREPRTDKPEVIADFLAKGNIFWYSLPPGYMDMGPRVILEAMASGLPILADKWGGATDRVTPECGWLCNTKEEMVEIVKNLTFDELKKKGEAARERAKTFDANAWIEEIINV